MFSSKKLSTILTALLYMENDRIDILIKKLELINTELDELVYLSSDIKSYASNIDKF